MLSVVSSQLSVVRCQLLFLMEIGSVVVDFCNKVKGSMSSNN